MSNINSPIIKAEELVKIYTDTNFVLVDARSGADVHDRYLKKHLKGSVFVDLEKQLADIQPDVANGGRHPLPDVRSFAELAGELGIDDSSQVVVYDDKNGANAAARFWWMLRAIGHQDVQVLDGGYNAAIKAGFPTSSGEEKAAHKEPYHVSEWQLPTFNMQQVEQAAADDLFTVIDVREKMRYDGDYEPIDLIAGHIPGAINIPYTYNLDENGYFLPDAQLREKYLHLLTDINPAQIIVHCGSGVTACHTLLAMDEAGLGIPALYTGSWSEWSRNNKPIAQAKK
ncbi:MAG: sulfurtransferase [Ginsengibacter sp.]